MIEPLFEMRALGLDWAGGVAALSDVDLAIAAGERLVVMGSNGCGKSTLLRVMDALIEPTRGELRFEGPTVDAVRLRDRAWTRRFRQRVALMFQQPQAMLFNASVAEEIGYGLRHLEAAERDDRVRHWAGQFGLEHQLDRAPAQLSGGEQQRLCLACLLAPQPDVLLLDEPTTNLDPRTVGWLVDWLAEQPLTVVVATHHLGHARELGERAVILSEDHRVAYDGPIERALDDIELLLAHNLAHRHAHVHGRDRHRHGHDHDESHRHGHVHGEPHRHGHVHGEQHRHGHVHGTPPGADDRSDD